MALLYRFKLKQELWRDMSPTDTKIRCVIVSSEQGVTLMETILIIPVVLVLLVGTLVIGSVLRTKETAYFASREVANTIFRECASVIRSYDPSAPQLDADGKNEIDRCIEGGGFTTLNADLAALFGSKLITSVYVLNGLTAHRASFMESNCGLHTGCHHADSQHSELSTSGLLLDELNVLRHVIVVELYVSYPEIVKSSLGFFQLQLPPIYVVSVA